MSQGRYLLLTMGCIVFLVIVVTAMTLGAAYLAEGDCIFESNAHKARCQ